MRKIIISALSALMILFYFSVSVFAADPVVHYPYDYTMRQVTSGTLTPTANPESSYVSAFSHLTNIVEDMGSVLVQWERTAPQNLSKAEATYGWNNPGESMKGSTMYINYTVVTTGGDVASGTTVADYGISAHTEVIDSYSTSYTNSTYTINVDVSLRTPQFSTGSVSTTTYLYTTNVTEPGFPDYSYFPVYAPVWFPDEDAGLEAIEQIGQQLDDLRDDLMGTASHPAIDEMSGTTAGVQSRADAVLDGLDVGNIQYSIPPPIVVDANASGVLSWIFSLDFVWTLVLTACGLWVAKVVLYGIG